MSNGIPRSKPHTFCRPGFSEAIPGHAPPTVIARYAPKAMWHPETMPSLKISPFDFEALPTPAATAPWYKAGGG